MALELKDVVDLVNARFDRVEKELNGAVDVLNEWGQRIVRLEQWREDHDGNCHRHINQALAQLRGEQETQGEKLYHLASEVAKWSILILLVANIVVSLLP